jgi:transcriptional regulator with XRE-family HTH domain
MGIFHQRFKKARIENNYTQESLAKALSVTKGTVSNYENGYSTPSYDILVKAADAFKVTTDYLLGREGAFLKPKEHEWINSLSPEDIYKIKKVWEIFN